MEDGPEIVWHGALIHMSCYTSLDGALNEQIASALEAWTSPCRVLDAYSIQIGLAIVCSFSARATPSTKPSGDLTWFLFSGGFPAHSLQCFVPLDSTTPQPAPHCISPPRSYSLQNPYDPNSFRLQAPDRTGRGPKASNANAASFYPTPLLLQKKNLFPDYRTISSKPYTHPPQLHMALRATLPMIIPLLLLLPPHPFPLLPLTPLAFPRIFTPGPKTERRTDGIILHHTERSVCAWAAEGPVVACQGHADEADGYGAGFRWRSVSFDRLGWSAAKGKDLSLPCRRV